MINTTEAEKFFNWAFPNWDKPKFARKLKEWEDRQAFPDECLGVVENSLDYPPDWVKFVEY
jgi:hypothetical protein